MILIISIPSPDSINKDKPYKYIIRDGKEDSIEAISPSLAMKEYLEKSNKELKILLLFPISLYLLFEDQKNLKNGIRYDKIEEKIKEKFGNCEIFFFPSIGTYNNKEFKGDFKEIEALIFLKVVEEILKHKENIKAIYLDISTGQNIYISLLTNVIKKSIVFAKLFNLDNETHKLEFKIFYSEPVIPIKEKDSLKLNFVDFDTMTIFKPQIKSDEVHSGNVIKNIEKIDINWYKEKSKKLKELLIKNYIIYNSVKNCAPLVCFYMYEDDVEELERMIFEISEITQKKFREENFLTSIGFKGDSITNIVISISLFIGLKKLLKKLGLTNKSEIELEELRKFKEIYENEKIDLKTNLIFLENEIENIENKIKNFANNKDIKDYLKLKDIEDAQKNQDSSQKPKYTSNIKRNFFAHAGLERSITYFKVENNKIILKYDEKLIEDLRKFRGEIFKWLMKNEKSQDSTKNAPAGI